jgi:hypothetical protein
MRRSTEADERSPWSPEPRTLMDSAHLADLRWGSLVLAVFLINVAVVMLAWLLVGLLN